MNVATTDFRENASDMDRRGHEAAAFVGSLGAQLETAYWGPVDYVNSPDEMHEYKEIEEACGPCPSGTAVASCIAHRSWPADHTATLWTPDIEAMVLESLQVLRGYYVCSLECLAAGTDDNAVWTVPGRSDDRLADVKNPIETEIALESDPVASHGQKQT
jgi:hypothetical protein